MLFYYELLRGKPGTEYKKLTSPVNYIPARNAFEALQMFYRTLDPPSLKVKSEIQAVEEYLLTRRKGKTQLSFKLQRVIPISDII